MEVAFSIANFGNTAVAEAADELKLFIMAEAFPLTQVVSFIGIVLVVIGVVLLVSGI